MVAEWFYTTKKQQMGPVSWMELRELVDSGILKPHDMVWTEGMDEWVNAINQDGLFAADGAAAAGRKKSSYAEAKPPPGRRKRRRAEEEDDEDEEDDREEKRKARRRSEERAKMGVGLKVGLILGGGFLLLLFLGCGIGGLVWLTVRGGDTGPGQHNFTVRNLPQQRSEDRAFRFQQGRRVIITVTNTTQFPNTDVDLHVLRGVNGNDIIALDERVPMQDRNCRLDINIPATDTYRVRVVNLGPGMANSCVVNITVQ